MVTDLSNESIKRNGKSFYNFSDRVDLNTSLMIGLSPTNYHTFLLCKDIEYHPSLSMRKARLLKRKNSVIRACAFLHIYDLDPILVDTVRQNILAQVKERTGSCHMGIINFLEKSIGLKFQSPNLRYQPSQVIVESAESKKMTIQNRPSENFELCLVRDVSPESMIQDIKSIEKKFFFGYVASYSLLRVYNFFKIQGDYKVSTELRTLVES